MLQSMGLQQVRHGATELTDRDIVPLGGACLLREGESCNYGHKCGQGLGHLGERRCLGPCPRGCSCKLRRDPQSPAFASGDTHLAEDRMEPPTC